jgi:hypothetical protein
MGMGEGNGEGGAGVGGHRVESRLDGMVLVVEGLGTADLTVEDGVVVWGMSVRPYGTARYTIRLNDQGQWTEIGVINRDGAVWAPFFEMTLDRVVE